MVEVVAVDDITGITPEVGHGERIDKRIKAANAELRELVAVSGSTLMELTGIGPCDAGNAVCPSLPAGRQRRTRTR
jgi:hypothetical protein